MVRSGMTTSQAAPVPRHVPAVRVALGRFGLYGLLLLVLLLLSTIIVLDDQIPIAGPNPTLAVAEATLAGVVGLALFYLGLLRFRIFGRPLDLAIGIGFGTLALANLVIRVALPASTADPTQQEPSLYLRLFLRAVAAVLFCLPVLQPYTVVPPHQQRRYLAWTCGITALVLALGATGIIGLEDHLPAAIGPAGQRLLDADALIFEALPGQAPWLLVCNSAIGVLMVLATLGYLAQTRRPSADALTALPLALLLLTIGQFHTLLFPPGALDYVSTALVFRLLAYLTLCFSLVTRLGHDLVERATGDERRRLSRELHDGLLQQLSLLNLRLNQARAPKRAPAARERDLTAAARVLEAALLEARQAITALRTGTLSWAEFAATLDTFTDEFAQNHAVAVPLRVTGQAASVDAGLQAEVLRILHETFSNAIRHGQATQITVDIAAEGGWLTFRIKDNGRGFVPGHREVGTGVGLQSLVERVTHRQGELQVDTRPGRGVTICGRLLLAPPPGAR